MSDKSKIEWTDATWNPLRGCSRVSEGCRHCYAEGVAARFSGPGMPYEGLAKRVTLPGGGAEARWTGKVAFAGDQVLTQPLRWKKPRRIFVNSMSDLFHESVPDAWIDRIFAVMALCPQHTFQVLTKRPERMRGYLLGPWQWRLLDHIRDIGKVPAGTGAGLHTVNGVLPNVWLGVSVEDQVTADTRIPYLLQTPAAVRFISAEPLLGPVNLMRVAEDRPFLGGMKRFHLNTLTGHFSESSDDLDDDPDVASLDWVIVGGESGPDARPMHPHWARSLRDQCASAEVAFFFKQWGEFAPLDSFSDAEPDGNVYRVGKRAAGRLLDGIEHNGFPEVRHG